MRQNWFYVMAHKSNNIVLELKSVMKNIVISLEF